MTATELMLLVVDAFEREQIDYMVVGSFSSNVYGLPRSTKDADFVVTMDASGIERIATRIGPGFALDPQMSFETITGTMRHRFRHKQHPFLIEIFLLSNDPHDRERFARRVRGPVGDRHVFLPTAEDVVITKLRWSRSHDREKDVLDVKDVLEVQVGKLDLPYIRHWCDQHGTRELFDKMLAEAEAFDRDQP